jgi:hypothetical protein
MLSPNDVALSKGQPVKPVDPRLVMTSPVTGKPMGVWTGKVTK